MQENEHHMRFYICSQTNSFVELAAIETSCIYFEVPMTSNEDIMNLICLDCNQANVVGRGQCLQLDSI